MSALQRITELAGLMARAAAQVDALKQQLSDAQAAHRRIEQEDLPDLMREIGLAEFVLTDGTRVQVTEDVTCSITEERRAAAHEWLVAHGFGGLIKTEVVVAFGRDEQAMARSLADKLAEELDGTAVPEVLELVHPSTLKAFIKERMQAGQVVPFDLFGVHPFSRAKLASARKR